jgi:hypothetical protein
MRCTLFIDTVPGFCYDWRKGGIPMKKLSVLFCILALVLSHAMCAAVAYTYCELLWCGQYGGCSAPASIAFLLAIPYCIGIAICIGLTILCYKKGQKQP